MQLTKDFLRNKVFPLETCLNCTNWTGETILLFLVLIPYALSGRWYEDVSSLEYENYVSRKGKKVCAYHCDKLCYI